MRPFSVEVPGENPGRALPVLAIRTDGWLLTADKNNTRLVWRDPADCRLGALFYNRDELVFPPWAGQLGPAEEPHPHG